MNTYIPILSDDDILKPTEGLIIDANRYINLLYGHKLDQYVIEPKKGLWLPWTKEPYFPQGTYLVKIGDSFHETDILTDLLNATDIVINKSTNKTYFPDQLKKIKGKLIDQPSYPVEMVNLVYAQVKQYLMMLAPVNRQFDLRNNRVSNYIKPDIPITSELLDSIEVALDDLFLVVNEFIAKDCNHLIHSRINNTNIIIEKLVDYRIFDWNRTQRAQLETEDE